MLESDIEEEREASTYYAIRPSTTAPSSPIPRIVRVVPATATMLEVMPMSPLIRTQLWGPEGFERRRRRACPEPTHA